MSAPSRSPAFPLNTILRLEHFLDPAFAALLRRLFPHWDAAHPGFPAGSENAKCWEVAQCVRALESLGACHPDAELLGVGAGAELTRFYLTNAVRRVFATDLYGTTDTWQEAAADMLVNPDAFAPHGYAWNPRRLVVQHMDGRALRYEDAAFDGVFSCGSIEHFGSLDDVARAAREMGRVLKPGGVLALATEWRIAGPAGADGIAGAILFTPTMLDRAIIGPSGLIPVDAPVLDTTAATIAAAYPLVVATRDGVRPRSVALSHDGFIWTSGILALRKPFPDAGRDGP